MTTAGCVIVTPGLEGVCTIGKHTPSSTSHLHLPLHSFTMGKRTLDQIDALLLSAKQARDRALRQIERLTGVERVGL